MLVLIFSKNTYASLKINEVYPAPIPGEYEWVEIYNDENTIIDLSQYSLYDLTNKKIKFTNTILQPLSFEIATSSGVLNNDGDTLSLKNNLGEIIEIATYSASFDSTKTYAKCPDFNGNWFILNLSTKNDSNETACQSLTPIPTLTITPTLTIVPTEGTENPSPTESLSYNNIYISEAMINPLIGEKEWVEIYNDNDFSVSLNNWHIDDMENAGSKEGLFEFKDGHKQVKALQELAHEHTFVHHDDEQFFREGIDIKKIKGGSWEPKATFKKPYPYWNISSWKNFVEVFCSIYQPDFPTETLAVLASDVPWHYLAPKEWNPNPGYSADFVSLVTMV